ncbi:MAG: sulfatase [Opitutaceae bacterium]|nr:sulfatase [Opitutaceae bacterium]
MKFLKPSLLLALIGYLAALPVGAHAAAPAKKLNVLLIAVDDLRDTLGCYGHAAVKTPHIDRLAARSVRFDRAYVQYPVCNASRSSFLTGLRPDQTGVTDNSTLLRDRLPDVVTLPQLLKDDGRHAAAFGKIFHLGGGRDDALRAKWVDLPRSWHAAESFQATPLGRQKLSGRDLTQGKLAWCNWGAMAGDDDDQPDGQIARAVSAEIEKLGDRPWIIGAGFMKPHDPFVAPKKYFDLYPEGALTLHRPPGDQTPAPPLAVGFGGLGAAFAQFTDRERDEFLRAYYACTTFMDAQVGRVLATLDRLHLWETTIVIFLGDHGYHLGERAWWNKNTLFDRSCRAPLLIAAPGIKPGVARGLVEFVDLYPTIAELCGLTPPPNLAGQSFRPLLRNPSSPGKPAAFTLVKRGTSRGDSIRTDRWRFTRWSDGATELYDHTTDPEEDRNVASTEPAVVRDLGRQLSAALDSSARSKL